VYAVQTVDRRGSKPHPCASDQEQVRIECGVSHFAPGGTILLKHPYFMAEVLKGASNVILS
jgi:hypothetical protein